MGTPRAILFDLDGVLLKSEEVWLRLLEDAGRKYRGSPVTRAEFAPTFGQGSAADVRVFGFGCTARELDAYYAEHFRQHLTKVWVDPTARATLQALADRGLKLAVVTNTTTPLARDLLNVAGLLPFFLVVACADQVKHAKPSPDVVLHALEGLGLSASDAWMVGDSRYDREAAAGAGVRFVGLRLPGDLRIEELARIANIVSP